MLAATLGLLVMFPVAASAKNTVNGDYSGDYRLKLEPCTGGGNIHLWSEYEAKGNLGKGTIFTDACVTLAPAPLPGVIVMSATFRYVTPKGTLYANGQLGHVPHPGEDPCPVFSEATLCSGSNTSPRALIVSGGTGSFAKVDPGGTITLNGFYQGVFGVWPLDFTAVANGTISGELK